MDQHSPEEIPMLENTLQNILLQKQAFNMELSETDNSIKEINSSKEDVFKIVGQLMIKSNKDSVLKDLENKKKMLELRLKNLDGQEDSVNEQIEKLREGLFEKK